MLNEDLSIKNITYLNIQSKTKSMLEIEDAFQAKIEDIIYKYYYEKGMHGNALARKLEISYDTLKKWMNLFSIPIRSFSETTKLLQQQEGHNEKIAEGVAKSWQNMETRANRMAGLKAYYETDEAFQHKSKAMQKVWQNKEYHENVSNRLKELWQDEEYCQKMLDIRNDDTFKQKISQFQKELWQDKDYQQKMSKMHEELWRSDDYREKQFKSKSKAMKKRCNSKAWKEKFQQRMFDYWQNDENRKKRSNMMKELWQRDDYREKMGGTNSEWWAQASNRKWFSELIKQKWQDPEYAEKVLMKCGAAPNIPEAIINKITPLNVKYTGDGTFWRTLLSGKHANPDFIVNPIRKTKKVIYFHGVYWHRRELENRGEELINQWEQIGYKCLIIWEDELNENLDKVLNKIADFINQKEWQLELF